MPVGWSSIERGAEGGRPRFGARGGVEVCGVEVFRGAASLPAPPLTDGVLRGVARIPFEPPELLEG